MLPGDRPPSRSLAAAAGGAAVARQSRQRMLGGRFLGTAGADALRPARARRRKGSGTMMSSIASTFAADYRNGRRWP